MGCWEGTKGAICGRVLLDSCWLRDKMSNMPINGLDGMAGLVTF